MPGDWNLGVDHAANYINSLFAALHLDRFGATFLHEAGCVLNRVFGVDRLEAAVQNGRVVGEAADDDRLRAAGSTVAGYATAVLETISLP